MLRPAIFPARSFSRTDVLGLDWIQVGKWSLVAPHFTSDCSVRDSKALKSPSIIVISLNPWDPRRGNVLLLFQQLLTIHSIPQQQQTVLLFHASYLHNNSHFRTGTGIEHFRENNNICKLQWNIRFPRSHTSIFAQSIHLDRLWKE